MTLHKPTPVTLGSQGFTINTNNNDHFEHSPITDASYESNPFMLKTPGSEGSSTSAFHPVSSPPRIQRKSRGGTDIHFFKEDINYESQCDTTQDTSVNISSPVEEEPSNNKTTFKSQLKQIKKSLPKSIPKSMMKSMKQQLVPKKTSIVDLSDLAIATICIVPRLGGGIAVGRMPFERMRTSLMVHMIQVVDNNSIGEECTSSKGDAQIIANLNTNLRNSIADDSTCFVEKSQDAVRLAKDTLQELEASEGKVSKSELGQRNLICTKFLAGLYREVINDSDTSDGLSLMVIANAYYALGKHKPALSVLQESPR